MDNKELSITSDSEYKKLLSELKEKVRSSQLKAAIKVNYELLDLYWMTVLTGANVLIGTSINIVFQSSIAPFHRPGRSRASSLRPSLLFSDMKAVLGLTKDSRLNGSPL